MTRGAGDSRTGARSARRGLLPVLLLVALGLTGIAKLGFLLGQTVGPSAPDAASRTMAGPPSVDDDEMPLFEPAAGPAETIEAAETAGEPAAGDDAVAPLDPTRLTPSEIEVLQLLAARRAELERREEELDLREASLGAVEARLREQAGRLDRLRAEIEAQFAQIDQKEQERLGNLVKIYEAMKPKAAAEIFDRLEMPVALQVVQRMRETKAADVLARMDPAKAEQLTAELARRRPAPAEGGSGSGDRG